MAASKAALSEPMSADPMAGDWVDSTVASKAVYLVAPTAVSKADLSEHWWAGWMAAPKAALSEPMSADPMAGD